ncbi:MAG TPA: hypothetical protein DIT89_10215 [Planctomycetaceae bacterium]|nr:hypothetical protein [Planctomycetaceae bacterium]
MQVREVQSLPGLSTVCFKRRNPSGLVQILPTRSACGIWYWIRTQYPQKCLAVGNQLLVGDQPPLRIRESIPVSIQFA